MLLGIAYILTFNIAVLENQSRYVFCTEVIALVGSTEEQQQKYDKGKDILPDLILEVAKER